MTKKTTHKIDRTLSVAPMMDWTDRHCRYLHRLLSKGALLYTEMVTAPALIHGDPTRLLRFDVSEHPVALQLGGSDPDELATATKMGEDAGYDEVNLNVGCPSDRVQSGRFGACLMREPELVADCVSAMIEAADKTEITVKCRIGVDDQVPEESLPRFVEMVSSRGVNSFTIHARKAWLQGLSPKQNRDIPPLNYPLVHQMKSDFPSLEIILNGGLTRLSDAKSEIDKGLDGAMIGRSAYHDPTNILGPADRVFFGASNDADPVQTVRQMIPYIEAHIAEGGRLHQVTRHMLGLFSGRPGARAWKRYLSENAHKNYANSDVLETALARVSGPEAVTAF